MKITDKRFKCHYCGKYFGPEILRDGIPNGVGFVLEDGTEMNVCSDCILDVEEKEDGMDMTKLDELIKDQRDAAQMYLDAISKIDPFVYCDDTEVMKEKEETLRYIANQHNEIAYHLEELKTLRKAYELMSYEFCKHKSCYFCQLLEICKCSDKKGSFISQEYFLKKAGEYND